MARRKYSDTAMQAALDPSVGVNGTPPVTGSRQTLGGVRARTGKAAPSPDTRIRDWMTGGGYSKNLKAGKGVRVK